MWWWLFSIFAFYKSYTMSIARIGANTCTSANTTTIIYSKRRFAFPLLLLLLLLLFLFLLDFF